MAVKDRIFTGNTVHLHKDSKRFTHYAVAFHLDSPNPWRVPKVDA
jgi:hypothetical protein